MLSYFHGQLFSASSPSWMDFFSLKSLYAFNVFSAIACNALVFSVKDTCNSALGQKHTLHKY